MPTYLVEFYLSGAPGAADAADELAARLEGIVDPSIRLVHALSVPSEDFCLCLCEAASAQDIEAAIGRAGLVAAGSPQPVQMLGRSARSALEEIAAAPRGRRPDQEASNGSDSNPGTETTALVRRKQP